MTLFSLLGGVTSNQSYYCLNCFDLFRTKAKFESHKEVCKNRLFLVVMPSKDIGKLIFTQ